MTTNITSSFWEPLNPGWFIQWGVEREAKRNPGAAITVLLDGEAICGFVPNEVTAPSIELYVKPEVFNRQLYSSVVQKHCPTGHLSTSV